MTSEENKSRCRAYYLANRDAQISRCKKYQKEHAEQISLYGKFRYYMMAEIRSEQKRQWRSKNLARARASCRLWASRNPSKRRMNEAKRRASRFNSVAASSKRVSAIYEKCQWYKKMGFDVVVDHIFPISLGGPHRASNLQIIYAKENSIKHSRTDYAPKIIFK